MQPSDADEIASWAGTDEDLRLLAPGTSAPLTAEKVVGWRKPAGHAFVLANEAETRPTGYAELNPMRGENGHWWLGHVIVRGDRRGQGIGTRFVRALLSHAFEDLWADRVSLIVFPGNRAAVDCYRRAGLRPVGEEFHRFSARGPACRLLRLELHRAEFAIPETTAAGPTKPAPS